MVREPGSECYAYASIRVKIWDLPDQSNNIWYFGDGAGLDFNPDPNDPNGPSPRPISQPHAQNIPAGTSTISDETGQVLFFTDGASVWDLNGDLMANGDSIGGDNLSSESVIAVPVPQDETLFYLFTTQKSDNGENEVKFSVVDIKAENPLGIGNVVSKGNFLFSPSTEHTAGLSSGDTTWMMFHELGNNTFRAYPVTANGIGPPALSSAGSNHSFGTGVGSMKFSPDGSKLAVTIQEGNCSKLEIFDFNQDTGQLTAYALLDLGCGEEVYGLEFSNDSNRVFVSYIGSGSKVEEFIIQDPSEPAPDGEEPTPSSCAECFQNASNRAQIQACILGTRNNISSDGPFGALQIGPDGQIYVARPGQNILGQIQVAQNCDDSFYNENGSEPMPGTSNLGLPSFVQQSGSNIPDPVLSGPERLCLDPVNGAGGLFEGEGEPDIDSYFWTITREDGVVELAEFGGAGESFQSLEHFFQTDGLFTVSLRVDRCGDANYFEEEIDVLVVAPPTITLQDDVTLCSSTPVTLTAIEGYDPAEGLYDFEWRNAAGILFGDVDSNSIEVNEESIYTVTVGHRVPADQDAEFFDVCPASKSVFVGPAFEFELTFSAEEVCYDESLVVFAPNTPVTGEWYYQQVGNPNRILLGEFFELELVPEELPSPGLYEIIFITQDPVVEGCLVEKSVELTVHPLPNFELQVLNNADDCATPNGSFEITMLLDADLVEIVETGQTFNGVGAGDVLLVENLAPGIYSVQSINAFGCQLIQTVAITNLNPPIDLEYTVLTNPEVCGPTGVEAGAIIISFTNGPQSGSYVVTRQVNGQQFTDDFVDSDTLVISVEEGEYAVSVSNGIGCTVPEPVNYQVDGLEAVVFSVPTDLIACESFTFSPQTDQNLIFTLLDPLGNPVLSDVDGNFVLTTSGLYQLTGEDPDGLDCPREVDMQVTINNPLDYSVSEPIIDCFAGISYSAELNGTNPADVYFLWRNPEGVIVGRTQIFYPSKAGGTYSLEVQPRVGASCPTTPIEFEVEEFGQEVDVILELLPFCAEDPFTLISLNADLSQVTGIQWFLVQGSNTTRIPGFDDAEAVTILDNGTYEAVLFNTYNCIVGWGRIQVTKSTIVPPVVEPFYVICGPESVGTEIDPGDYPFYSWQLDGVEIADTPTFTPVLPGEYTLTVSDEIGCEFSVVFEAVEDCELKIIFPNALRPSDPSRHFIIYANDFIDEIDVFIYNRWGQLIYYCEQENVNGEETVCTWDGTVGGNAVPIGTYPVVVRYRSNDQNLVKTLKKSILVIE
jgi:large repetitive protein